MNKPLFSDVRFYDRPGYFAELQHCAERAGAGDTITVMAMEFDPSSPEMTKMMTAMRDAAKRGAIVQTVIDAHSLMVHEQRLGPLWFNPNLDPSLYHGSFKNIYDSLQSLRLDGGDYRIINRPTRRFSNPYGGRSHIKLALVNDRVFIGGCNLSHPEMADIMVAWHDAATAEWLRELVRRIGDAPSVRQAMENTDIERRIASNARILVDAGVKQQSLILRQAYHLIDEAKEEITITCQYFPGGRTAQHLLQAHKRGVKVTIYFSPPSTHGSQAPGHWLYNAVERIKLPKEFFANQVPADKPKLHAKILVSEKAAMVGSHNYVQAGVNFGTAEIALLSDDPEFIERTRQHIGNIVSEL